MRIGVCMIADWNDCPYPDEAMTYWKKHFLYFDLHWQPKFFPYVHRQPSLKQNFAFKMRHCLFVGCFLVGGDVIDEWEWDLRLRRSIGFVRFQLRANLSQINTVVVFGHTALRDNVDPFFDMLVWVARIYSNISFLYIHGDMHKWKSDFPWDVPNLGRVQLDKGALAPPVLITVKPEGRWPFKFDRRL
mmetsp:Transcript_32308/g.74429  ORF Transcript_32308/g.74429 Transcript_32308/m.74429 type:complete len:188 (-) Transcript_32308:183-746(-)